MTPARIISAAYEAAKLGGCNCQPDITLVHLGHNLHRADIAHDHWCHLLTKRAAPNN